MAKSPDKSKVKGKKKGRPKFCPNSSKNTALNRSLSNSGSIEVEEELKKNNAELAKNLNLHKEALARVCGEKQELEREMMELRVELSKARGGVDQAEVEAEVERRVAEEMARLEQDLRAAVDHTMGLTSILTRLVATNSRNKRSSAVGGIRMREVVTSGPMSGGASWSKQLSKVSPMVAGHAISKPRIQLERIDLSSVEIPRQEEDDQVEEQEEEQVEEQVFCREY